MRSSNSSSSLSLTITRLIVLILSLSNLSNSEPYESLIQLPRSRIPTGRIRRGPRTGRVLHVTDFGATGNGITDDTEAFANAWKLACSFYPRSTIVIPEGSVYLVGPIDFPGPCRAKVTLRILGTVIAPKDPDAWLGLNPQKWLYFHGVNHLIVQGGGTVNGMGEKWWAQSCKVNTSNICHHAPTAIIFHRCKDLQVRDIRLVDSQQMHLSFTSCARVLVSNLDVVAPAESPNTDGIHISSSTMVQVIDTVIRTGDDCVSIVNNSSRIVVKGVACGPGHGISIGSLGKSESWAEVHDVVVDGAFLANTKNGLRIKTWQGGSGFAANITFQNVLMENVSNPILIDQYYCDSRLPCQNQSSTVQVSDISFKHVKGTSRTEEAVRFCCSDAFPCERLYLEDILLVSYVEPTKSFCWEAQGSSSGLVFPPPCFGSSRSFIQQEAASFLIPSTRW